MFLGMISPLRRLSSLSPPPTNPPSSLFIFLLLQCHLPLLIQASACSHIHLLRWSLQKNPSSPSSSKGILPLPHNFKRPSLVLEGTWIPVVNKKKIKRQRSAALRERFPLPPKKKCCFFCGDINHMENTCKIGFFVCFRCKEVGHTSRSWRLIYPP